MSVVGIFITCNSFPLAYYFTQAFIGPSYVMFVIGYFVAVLNSSLNPIVYGIFSKQYKEEFLKHFCHRKKQVDADAQPFIPMNIIKK